MKTNKGKQQPATAITNNSNKEGLGKASQLYPPSSLTPSSSAYQKKTAQPERHSLSASERNAVLRRDNYRCRVCGLSQRDNPALVLEVDHITPVSRGGTNDPVNLQTLCKECNRLKSNKI